MKYRRILLKLSGEILMGQSSQSFCESTARRVAREIAQAVREGVSMGIVMGGGNLFRGRMGKTLGISAPSSDTMGMLATVMNGVMLRDILEQEGVPVAIFSPIALPSVCALYHRTHVLNHLRQGEVCLFVAGIGHPFFTTDTAAVLRARETECDAVFKATKVPGVFSDDPIKNPQATHYPSLSYEEAIAQRLNVMDLTALTLAQEGAMPLVVFSILEPGSLAHTLQGQGLFSLIHP